jgi:hypothetical protein
MSRWIQRNYRRSDALEHQWCCAAINKMTAEVERILGCPVDSTVDWMKVRDMDFAVLVLDTHK